MLPRRTGIMLKYISWLSLSEKRMFQELSRSYSAYSSFFCRTHSALHKSQFIWINFFLWRYPRTWLTLLWRALVVGFLVFFFLVWHVLVLRNVWILDTVPCEISGHWGYIWINKLAILTWILYPIIVTIAIRCLS